MLWRIDKRKIYAASAMLIVFAILVLPHVAFGIEEGADPPPEGGNAILSRLGYILGNMLITMGAWIAGLGGALLDSSIQNLVLEMGQRLTGAEGLALVVDNIWQVVRDFANVVFIFGFIYIGIRTILQPDNNFTKSFLAKLIIAALLINFSLFFTKVVIDVANTAAFEINNLMVNNDGSNIGWTFAKYLGLEGWYGNINGEDLKNLTSGGSVAFFVIGFMFLVIAGFVFAAGAVMITIRFVALMLIMMFSPLIFAAVVFPQTAKFSGVLWSMLLRYAFFAPIFLFLVYVSLRVLSVFSVGTDGAIFANLANSQITLDTYSVMLQFTVAILFLIFALMAAQKLSLAGGDGVMKAAHTARGYGQRLLGNTTFGLAARIGRNTAGYAGKRATESKWARNLALKGGKAGLIGKAALIAGKRTSEASFDARRVGGVGKPLGIGEGKKGGYAQQVKDAEKRNKEIADMLGEDERVYEENGVQDQLRIYKKTVDERDDALRELATETDENERKKLTQKIYELGSEIDYMEKAGTRNAPKVPESMVRKGNGSEYMQGQFEKFAATKKSVGGLRQEQFAINLQRRGENLWPVVRHVYNWTINDRYANKESAKSIRKDIKRTDNDKLLAAVRERGGGGDAGSTE